MGSFNFDIFLYSIFDKDPHELVILDFRDIESIVDYMIVCHCNSNRQVSSIAKYVKQNLKRNGVVTFNFEGIKDGNWVILDYDRVLIHIFLEKFRNYYNLEELWFDIKKIKINDLNDYLNKKEFFV